MRKNWGQRQVIMLEHIKKGRYERLIADFFRKVREMPDVNLEVSGQTINEKSIS